MCATCLCGVGEIRSGRWTRGADTWHGRIPSPWVPAAEEVQPAPAKPVEMAASRRGPNTRYKVSTRQPRQWMQQGLPRSSYMHESLTRSASGVMRFLQTEWHRHERDRNAWQIERAEMKARIGKLEGDLRTNKKLRESMDKHIRMLENALKKSREKGAKSQDVDISKSGGLEVKTSAKSSPTSKRK